MAMSPEQWGQMKELFRVATRLEPLERAAYLDQACDGNAALRVEIESLLTSHDDAENFIETPAIADSVSALAELPPETIEGRRIGQYRLVREIGRGGMGTVYLAERADEQYRKLVAIKVVRRGMDTEDILRRFRNERQILAALEHTNIARLLDGGTTDDGLPYLVMEYVEGTPITDYCDQHRLTADERLHLFRSVCAPVQHAHQNLVIHRDLKPSNILITSTGMAKLLDFGIAKVLNPEVSAFSMEPTRTELRVLTPDYASPEQVRGEKLTTTSDVYSLGVVLYELLTGHRPYRSGNTPPQELERVICEQEPTKPSTAVQNVEVVTHGDTEPQTTITPESVSRARDTLPDKLRRRLAGDLDNIVLMALRKESARRYKSVEQFSEDIEKHLTGLPVIARKDTFKYRASKFIGRNRVGVTAATLVFLVIIAGLTVSVWQARVAARERDQARREKAKAEQLNKFLQSILSSASPEEKGKDTKVIEVLNDAASRIDTEFATQPELKAQALLTIGKTYSWLGQLNEAEKALREALRINLELYGDENESTAVSKMYLASNIVEKAQYVEGETLLTGAIATERRLYPSGSKDLATALFFLGETLVRVGQYERARPLLQESVSMYDKFPGEENRLSAIANVALARAQQFSGDLVGAEAGHRKAIAILRGQRPHYEGSLAQALANLGYVLTTEGKYDEGLNALREADSILKKQGDSFYWFQLKVGFCRALWKKGDYEDAIDVGKPALEMGERLHSEGAPDFIYVLQYVGMSLTRTGKAKDAEPLVREALERTGKVFPKVESKLSISEGVLGECLLAQGKFAEAEPLIVHSYEVIMSQGANTDAGSTAKPRYYTDDIWRTMAIKRIVELYEKWKKPALAAKYRTAGN